MLYLKVKYRSNEVGLRVEYPPVTHTLLGLVRIFTFTSVMGEMIWNPWDPSAFKPLAWTTHVRPGSLSILLTQLLTHLTSEVKTDPSRGLLTVESFIKCRMSSASTGSHSRSGGLHGPADPNPWQLCSDALLGRVRSAAGKSTSPTLSKC